MKSSLTIFYKCACMPAEASISVRHRTDSEAVEDWMEMVRQMLSNDHHQRSPICVRATMEYAKIPMPENAPFMGGKPKLQS